jgi:peptidylprolyl isomerase
VSDEKDYYAVLDINPHADRRAIAEAYERLARKYQPDDNAPPSDPQAMREIDEAFDVLDDPERRAAYDRMRQQRTVAELEPPPAAVAAGWAPGDETAAMPGGEASGPSWLSQYGGPLLLGLGALAFIIGGVILLVVALTGDSESTVTLASGLQYVEVKEGSGEPPKQGDGLNAHYTGTLEDGTQFDTSRDGNPFVFLLGDDPAIIEGWHQGFATMREGGQRKLIIPPELAYGEEGSGDGTIPANATLTFDVELVDIDRIDEPVATGSGLTYIDLEPGGIERREAITAKDGDQVVVHFTGTLADGTKFADTLSQGQPYSFVLGSGTEIEGFEEGVSTMKVGGLRRLIIPPDLAYGAQPKDVTVDGQPLTIPANSILTFEVRFVRIETPGAPQ